VADESVSQQVRVRLGKRERLLESGAEPYPAGFERTAAAAGLRARYGDLPPDTFTGEVASVAGRVMLSRIGGKLCFARLRDGTGDIQVMISLARVGEQRLAAWKRDVDLGDHVGVTGEVITSRSGELSVLASSWTLTAKSLRPLPEKFRGLTDPESRVRQRYADLIVNPEARRSAELRAAVMHSIRSQLNEHGFLEVETPVLTPLHGGANARPFLTHANAYDSKVYLRIALELYLKRLVVGGIERVYEIGRIFRNEGADAAHNPEFTMLEAYEAYGDYNTIGELTRELVQGAAVAAFGSTVIRRADGSEYDIGGDWPEVTVYDAISAVAGEEVTVGTAEAGLRELCGRLDVPVAPGWNRGQIVLEMYERLVEKRTVQPTFYRDFPVEVSPLVRQHRSDPRLAERWDLVVWGAELGTGYSELVDPVVQRARLTAQSLLKAGGDPEAMELDEDFLRALEYGMPPTGGMGMGIDRLLMTFTGENIRETLLFPFVRPDKNLVRKSPTARRQTCRSMTQGRRTSVIVIKVGYKAAARTGDPSGGGRDLVPTLSRMRPLRLVTAPGVLGGHGGVTAVTCSSARLTVSPHPVASIKISTAAATFAEARASRGCRRACSRSALPTGSATISRSSNSRASSTALASR
jgi:lysyl-tRNA synthetase class 2